MTGQRNVCLALAPSQYLTEICPSYLHECYMNDSNNYSSIDSIDEHRDVCGELWVQDKRGPFIRNQEFQDLLSFLLLAKRIVPPTPHSLQGWAQKEPPHGEKRTGCLQEATDWRRCCPQSASQGRDAVSNAGLYMHAPVRSVLWRNRIQELQQAVSCNGKRELRLESHTNLSKETSCLTN